MNKATGLFTILLSLFLPLSSLVSQQQGKFGLLLYSGESSVDLYMGRLTDTQYSKVEFYRGGKKLGEITLNGPDGGVVTDQGIAKGSTPTFEYRAFIQTGGFHQNLVGTVIAGVVGGDLKGYLTRRDEISGSSNLLDSIFVLPGGTIFINGNPVVVPGGELHLKPGANVTYDPIFSGKILGIKVFDAGPGSTIPGKFSASGGTLKDVNVECHGQFHPVENLTLIASDITILGNYPTDMTNCTLERLDAQGRFDFAFVNHLQRKITAVRCTVKNEGQLSGVISATQCVFEKNGILSASIVENCEFRTNAQVKLWPANTPTSCRNSRFLTDASISLSNKSVVEYNVFGPSSVVVVSPLAGNFDPGDVKDIRINFNEFQRDGGGAAILSVSTADTIDATRNYWGVCSGPTINERLGRRAFFDPYLRVNYPGTSYWFTISPNKTTMQADDEDEISFNGHFFNLLTNADSAGATVDYLVIIFGDTLQKGKLTMDANGQGTLKFKIPIKYQSVIAFQVYFRSIQCIDQAFLIRLSAPQGPDLEVYETRVVQVQGGVTDIIAQKPFTVMTTITTSEAVLTPFNIHCRVGGVVYDTFYVLNKNNLGVTYDLENPKTEITLPNGETLLIVFFINNKNIGPGTDTALVIIDPPDQNNTKGRVIEPIETNNTSMAVFQIKSSLWGNEGGANFDVFVQPFEDFPVNQLDRVTRWTDSTRTFMEATWPMTSGQVTFTNAGKVVDYTWLNPDTLRQETWQYYLMKTYKQLRLANPSHDRYVLAVHRDWFGSRFFPDNFQPRFSSTASWSGIYDFMVSTNESYKYLAHNLGHSFGLRRGDMDPNDEDVQEEYYTYFRAKIVEDAFDVANRRFIQEGVLNKVNRTQRTLCFMGNSYLSTIQSSATTWICDTDYKKLFSSFSNLTGKKFSKTKVAKALLIEGSVIDSTKQFEFGPWVTLNNATTSPMVEAKYATHVFKMLDANDQVLSTYLYRPTFVALGLDEVPPGPKMDREYFAFVIPYVDGAKKVIVEAGGTKIAERLISANPPEVQILQPTDGGDAIGDGGSFLAKWSATDPDGDTEFWYTVYFSSDNGITWKLIAFETKDIQALISAARGNNYKLRVIASDGVLSSEKTITFNVVLVSTAAVPVPGQLILHQNFPNPFNPSTTIRYTIPIAGHVTLEVLDALGRRVEGLYSGFQPAGTYSAVFDAKNHTSGVYTAILRFDNGTASMKMILTK